MAARLIAVTVAHATAPRCVTEVQIQLPPGSTVADALLVCGLEAGLGAANPDSNSAPIGIWGRKAALHQVLSDLDRVEIYRPLKVDPKVARRARFAKQGAKTAGLFAKLRDGAKSGY